LLSATLPLGQALWLVPEPTNEHDPNAIRVMLRGAKLDARAIEELREQAAHLEGYGFTPEDITENDWHLGYIPKTDAATIVRRLNAAIEAQTASGEATDQPPGWWPAHFDFTLEGKWAVRFTLPEASA